jgi:hypothetical protein
MYTDTDVPTRHDVFRKAEQARIIMRRVRQRRMRDRRKEARRVYRIEANQFELEFMLQAAGLFDPHDTMDHHKVEQALQRFIEWCIRDQAKETK